MSDSRWIRAPRAETDTERTAGDDSNFGLGAEQGAYGLEAGLKGYAAHFAKPMRREELQREADYASLESSQVPTRYNSIKDVGLFDVPGYVAQQAGAQAPVLGSMLVSGGLGGLALGANGARVGGALLSAAQQTGDMLNENRQAGLGNTGHEVELGLLGGAMDMFGLEGAARAVVKAATTEATKSAVANSITQNILRASEPFARATGKSVASELPAELGQEELAIRNRDALEPGYANSGAAMDRRTETAAATAALGPVFGAAGGVKAHVSAMRGEKQPDATPPADKPLEGELMGKPAQLGYDPDGWVVMPDGSTARRSDILGLIAAADQARDAQRADRLRSILEQQDAEQQSRDAQLPAQALHKQADALTRALPAPGPTNDLDLLRSINERAAQQEDVRSVTPAQTPDMGDIQPAPAPTAPSQPPQPETDYGQGQEGGRQAEVLAADQPGFNPNTDMTPAGTYPATTPLGRAIAERAATPDTIGFQNAEGQDYVEGADANTTAAQQDYNQEYKGESNEHIQKSFGLFYPQAETVAPSANNPGVSAVTFPHMQGMTTDEGVAPRQHDNRYAAEAIHNALDWGHKSKDSVQMTHESGHNAKFNLRNLVKLGEALDKQDVTGSQTPEEQRNNLTTALHFLWEEGWRPKGYQRDESNPLRGFEQQAAQLQKKLPEIKHNAEEEDRPEYEPELGGVKPHARGTQSVHVSDRGYRQTNAIDIGTRQLMSVPNDRTVSVQAGLTPIAEDLREHGKAVPDRIFEIASIINADQEKPAKPMKRSDAENLWKLQHGNAVDAGLLEHMRPTKSELDQAKRLIINDWTHRKDLPWTGAMKKALDYVSNRVTELRIKHEKEYPGTYDMVFGKLVDEAMASLKTVSKKLSPQEIDQVRRQLWADHFGRDRMNEDRSTPSFDKAHDESADLADAGAFDSAMEGQETTADQNRNSTKQLPTANTAAEKRAATRELRKIPEPGPSVEGRTLSGIWDDTGEGPIATSPSVGLKIAEFVRSVFKDIGLKINTRVIAMTDLHQHEAALTQAIDAAVQKLESAHQALTTLNPEDIDISGDKKATAAVARSQAVFDKAQRLVDDLLYERHQVRQAQKDSFAARVIYNDHYEDAQRRTPLIVLSNEVLGKGDDAREIALAHEIGHIVARSWFDGLKPEVKEALVMELTNNGENPELLEENFADRFAEWYRNQRAGRNLPRNPLSTAYQQLTTKLRELWRSVMSASRAFKEKYPTFDKYISSMVGIRGTLKPIDEKFDRAWHEASSDPYLGLPLRVSGPAFHDMSVSELGRQISEFATQHAQRADAAVNQKAAGNVRAERAVRKTKEYWRLFDQARKNLVVSDTSRLRNEAAGKLAWFADLIFPEAGKGMKGVQFHSTLARHTTTIQAAIKQGLVQPLRNVNALLTGGELVLDNLGTNGKPLKIQVPAFPKRAVTIAGRKLGEVIDTESPVYKETINGLLKSLPDAQLTPQGRAIRQYFNDTHAFLTGKGVDVGKMSRYFPRMFDLQKWDDEKDRVVSILEKIYADRRARETGTEYTMTARERAEIEYRRILTGETTDVFDVKTPREVEQEQMDSGLKGASFRFARTRPFSDEEYALLDTYLNRDLPHILTSYTRLAVRRAVWQTTTGLPPNKRQGAEGKYWRERFAKAKLDSSVMNSPLALVELSLEEAREAGEVLPDTYEDLKLRVIPSATGTLSVGQSPRVRRWASRIMMYQTLRTLGLSAFMSLPDLGVVAATGADAGMFLRSMREIMTKEGREATEQLAQTLGIIQDDILHHHLSSDMGNGGDVFTHFAHNVTDKFFTMNGMHLLSKVSLLSAVRLGQNYMQHHAELAAAGNEDSIKRLQELHPDLSPSMIRNDPDFKSLAVGQALQRFVNLAHMHDQQGVTPWWFNDWRFKVFAQLKSFTWKFANIVLARTIEHMRQSPTLSGAIIPPAILIGCTLPLAMAGYEGKEWTKQLFMYSHMKRKPKEKEMGEKLYEYFKATGVLGVYAGTLADISDGREIGKPWWITVTGPSTSQAFDISVQTADEWVPRAIPVLVAPWPGVRAATRSFLHDDLGFGKREKKRSNSPRA